MSIVEIIAGWHDGGDARHPGDLLIVRWLTAINVMQVKEPRRTAAIDDAHHHIAVAATDHAQFAERRLVRLALVVVVIHEPAIEARTENVAFDVHSNGLFGSAAG